MQEEIGRRVKELRTRGSLTQEQVATRAGVHVKYLSSIERGRVNLTIATASRIAEALEVSLPALFPCDERTAQDVRSDIRSRVDEILASGDDDKCLRLQTFLRDVLK